MDLRLTGKRALVTGASKGIGAAVAEALAAEGCSVALVARDGARLASMAEELSRRFSVSATAHEADLSDALAFAGIAAAEPEIDILVNNAGAVPPGGMDAFGALELAEAWRLKVFGYIGMTNAYYPLMKARGLGVIVNVIGLAGERVNADLIALTGGNAALIAMTRALGAEAPRFGVRVVGVNPSATATERAVSLWRAQAEKAYGSSERWPELQQQLPFGRSARPQEIADAIVFLACDRASYISGTVLNVDGGLNARP